MRQEHEDGEELDELRDEYAELKSECDALQSANARLLEALSELVGEWDQRNVEIERAPGYAGYPDSGGMVLARAALEAPHA